MKHLIIKGVIIISTLVLSFGCGDEKEPRGAEDTDTGADSETALNIDAGTVDPDATTETKILFLNLKSFAESDQIMFGQATPTTRRFLEEDAEFPENNAIDTHQSDCKDITGSHPAFYESDLLRYTDNETFQQANTAYQLTDMRAMEEAYSRGAVIGYCWHLWTPYGKYNDVDENATMCSDIVEETNGAREWFLKLLDDVAVPVFKDLGFPIVFRPFHEMNGGWFWWGSPYCSSDNYKSLFRLTVDHLRSSGVHNLLYAWSPDKSDSMMFYPGDAYVDVIGYDGYELGHRSYTMDYVDHLGNLADYAVGAGKVAALTETGFRDDTNEAGEQERYPDTVPEYWTEVFTAVASDDRARRIAWIASWFNRAGFAYVPYDGMPNQRAIDDFVELFEHPQSVFESDLPEFYTYTP